MAQIGDKIPVFTLKNEAHESINIADYIGKPMVIFFYPKDDTPGCTREACAFRDSFEEFSDAGITVFGISADSPESHAAFKKKYRLPFALLADEGNAVRKLFKVPTDLFGFIPGRVTYIVAADGTIKHIFKSQLQVEQHVKEALRILV
jgi:thioredoxin-dependent peroxiredoxin